MLLPRLAAAQADTTAPALRIHFSTPPLALEMPPVLRAPWLGGSRAADRVARWDSLLARSLDSVRTERALANRYLSIYGGRDRGGDLPRRGRTEPTGLLGLSPKYADLSLDGQARLEIRTDRLRNERCTSLDLLSPGSGCRGNFSAPRIDNEFNVLAGGVIGRRLHINVDYSSQRDFTGKNDIQVYYQGLEDEIIQRVEVGTVTFRPPPSRFITAAVPANNFGVNATFELGPLEFQAMAAQQKGSAVAQRTFTVGQQITQPQDRQVRDLDYETGRFFWVIDPALVPAYPAVDILNLNLNALPPTERPSQVQIYRYRAALSRSGTLPNIGGINAIAIGADSTQFKTALWELLIQNTDYYLDPSGVWLVLNSKLDPNDFLAVSYRTAADTRVGTLPTVDNPPGPGGVPRDTLRLVYQPQVGPASETFRHEMRQIYRVAGGDLDRNSLQVNLSVNESERPGSGAAATYLALLGLSIPTDDNVFDATNRLFPRARDPESVSQTVRESYLVFPSLQPFADSTRLLPQERSDSLYRTPQYLLLTQGPPARFVFRFQYAATGGGDRSTLDLNALQIREGSEVLSVGGRPLERGIDYSIDYAIGRVTFLNPDQLFGNNAATVSARFEERGIFAIAPTTILGGSARYSMGDRGNINLIGIYQYEQTAFNRPPLGFEPEATLVGGVTTDLHFKPNVVTRLLDGLATGGATAPSRLDLNAEFAVTRPDPNRAGAAYLEEFEGDAGLDVSMREGNWEFGSRPQAPDGLVTDLPEFAAGFDSTWAVALSWQNLIPACAGCGPVELRAEDIDPNIRIAGLNSQQETVMFMTLHADTAGGIVDRSNRSHWSLPERLFTPRWRSMVTPLSLNGLDLSREEFLEFWVFQPGNRPADSAGVHLVLDLGSVNEDALAIAPESLTVNGADTTYTGRQYVGVGRLDTERSPTGIFNAQTDDIGVLGDRPDSLFQNGVLVTDLPLCRRELSASVPVFPWGDLSARCTRGNGLLDGEDLDGDLQLNSGGAADNVFRYVVNLAASKYYVRDGVTSVDSTGRVSGWKLYRIPLREADAVIGSPNLRLVRHLRITVAAPSDQGTPDVVARFALARMKFIGSSWSRRAETPIAGISGSLGEPHGAVLTSVVSTANPELGYTPPPGVLNQANRKDGGQDTQGTQINEKSLRVLGVGMQLGERAEAYLRFPSGPQNLLKYRTLRFWVRGRGAGWDDGQLQAFLKLGTDDRNFYLYQTPASTTTWEPEAQVDLEVWRQLRGEIQSRFLLGQPPNGAVDCGASDSTAYVACQGGYLVFVGDPGIAPPNLARVQEMAAGIYRMAQTAVIDTAELWVDDIRLTEPVSTVGTALALNGRLIASDIADFSFSYVRQDGSYQQIGQQPSYRTTGALQLGSNVRLDRFLPRSLGLAAPATFTYGRTSVNPDLLHGTDLRAQDLVDLRKPESWSFTYTLALARNQRSRNWWVHGLIDPLRFSTSVTTGRAQTELSEAKTTASAYNLSYNLQMDRTGFRLPLGGLVEALPGFLRKTEGAEGIRNPLISLVPSNVRLSSGLTRNQSDVVSYQVQVRRPQDAGLPVAQNLNHLWRNNAGLTWQPLGMLVLSGDLTSTRDLRQYADSTPLGRLAGQARESFLGQDVGVERDRQLSTALQLAPRLTSWLRPRFATNSSFVLSRSLTSRPPVRVDGDTAGAFILPQTLNNSRSRDIGGTLDLGRALVQLFGDSSTIGRLSRRVRPLDYSNRLVRSSTFDLAAFTPDLGYQLALGGRESFRDQQGEQAISLGETRGNTLTGGGDLPFGLAFTLSYGNTNTLRFQRLGTDFLQTETRQREWPVGSVRFSRSLAAGPLSLLQAGVAFRQREGTTTQPAGPTIARSAISSSAVTPDLQLGFRNGLVVGLGYNDISQRNENNGNVTATDQSDISANLSYAFRLPSSVSRLRKQVTASVNALYSKAVTCLQQPTQPECTTISDTRRTELRGTLDTELLAIMRGGLAFGYNINEARNLNRKVSQIFISIYLTLSLYAGQYQ